MTEPTQIKYPNCSTIIDVQDILSHQLEEEIKKKYQAELLAERKKHKEEHEQLALAKREFEIRKGQVNELFQERLEKQFKLDKAELEGKLKAKMTEEQSEQFNALQKELYEKSEQVKELNHSRAKIETLKREKTELKEPTEAAAQKKLNELLVAEKDKIKRSEAEKNELKIKEQLKQLEDQKKLTEEMKQEQGSMQMQGEVQELAIEEWLVAKFPLDSIDEIKKGARGGDCIQVVNTRSQQNCGKIYYESKRTKEFNAN